MENKNINKEIDDLKSSRHRNSNSGENELLQFFIGILLLGAGLFMLSKQVMVHSAWYGFRMMGFNLSSGTVTIPLIIGIIWYFVNNKSIVAKIVITLGVIFIVLAVIMSVRINFIATSLYNYILIFGLIAAGSGLLLKNLFKKRD